MNNKGEVITAATLIIAGAIIFAGWLIAYKPMVYLHAKKDKPAMIAKADINDTQRP